MKKIILASAVFIVLTSLTGCGSDSIEDNIQKGDKILSEQQEGNVQKDKLNPGDEGYDAMVDDPAIYEAPPSDENILTKKIKNPTIALAAIDGTDLNATADGEVFGCNDKIVEYPLKGEFTPAEILQELLTMNEFTPDVGYYNSFLYSKNLKVEDVSINEKGETVINLSGQIITGGTCDGPRPLAQLSETIKLIGLPVENYQVNINGKDFFKVLSEMNDVRG